IAALDPALLLARVGAGDLERRQLLTVTLTLVVAGLVAELVNDDLGALAVLDHLGGDVGLGQRGGVSGDRLAVDEQERRERARVPGAGRPPVPGEGVADRDLVLVAAGANDRVHEDAPRCCRDCCPGYGSWPVRVKLPVLQPLGTGYPDI